MSDKDVLIQQLQNHGKSGMDNLAVTKIREMFDDVSKEWVSSFVRFSSANMDLEDTSTDKSGGVIQSMLLDSNDLYSTFGILIEEYPISMIYDTVVSSYDVGNIDRVLLILDIKYRQYQEILLDRISKKLAIMPQEEVYGFLRLLESRRDDFAFLKSLLEDLSNPKISKHIGMVAGIKKYIITNFMEDDLEFTYKDFFSRSTQKQELIQQVKQISNAYSSEELFNMTKEDLQDIILSIKQKELDEIKDKEDYDTYLAMFKKAIYEDDLLSFQTIASKALDSVSPECLNNLKNTLRLEDPLFDNKFREAQKEWHKFK